MNIAVAEHAKEHAGCLEIAGMDNSLGYLKAGARLARDAVAAARDDMVENSRERSKNRNREDVAVGYFQLSTAMHSAGIASKASEVIGAAQLPARGLVVIVQVRQLRKIDSAYGDICSITLIILRQRDVGVSTQRAGKKPAAKIDNLQSVVGEEQPSGDAVERQRLSKKTVIHPIGAIDRMDFRAPAVHPGAAEPGPPQGDGAFPSPILWIVIVTPDRETDCGRTLPFPFPEKFIQLRRSERAHCARSYCAFDV